MVYTTAEGAAFWTEQHAPIGLLRTYVRRDAPIAMAWLYGFWINEISVSVSQRVAFRQANQSTAPSILGGVSNTRPVNFARAPDGHVFMTNGLQPAYKWDGIRYQARTVGVTPPTTAATMAFSGTGSLTGTYTAYVRFVDEDGNPSNLSPISSSVTASAAATVTYTSVPVPTEAKVTRRQVLRNTAGQALTYYVDVDTTDLTVTTLTSTNTDTLLAANEAVPLFDAEGNSLANRYTVPPADKPYMVAYQDRMFAAGEVSVTEGSLIVTNGSLTVTGIATNWTESLEGRLLYVVGTGRSYEVDEVNVENQTMTLTETYKGSTDPFAVYSIRSSPAQRRTVYFSEPGLYEAWPATNGITLEENGDEVTGLMPADSFLFLLQRRHTYRLTYSQGPLVDGGLFLATRRGCVNNRSWVQFDGDAYCLDEQGAYKFAGGDDAESVSESIRDLFWLDHEDNGLHVNWNARDWFHASHSKDESCVRWFVAMSGSRLPRHALVYNYAASAWWIEEYAFPISASCLTDGALPRPLVCGPARKVFAQGVSTLDGPDPGSGTTRGTMTAATLTSITDGLASFPASRLTGHPVVIVDGTGKGQTNLIASVSGTEITLVRPWLIQPDTTSVYQLGGVSWRWRSGLYRWINKEGDQQRRVEILFRPVAADAQMDLRIFKDFASAADKWGRNWPPSTLDRDAVHVVNDEEDAVVDLTQSVGFAQVRLSGRRDLYVEKADVVAVELAGVSATVPVTVYEVNLEGAE